MKTQPEDHVVAFVVGTCVLGLIAFVAALASYVGVSTLLRAAGGVLAAYVVGWAVLGLIFRQRGLL